MYNKKSVGEMVRTEPFIRSKFRTKTYDGWAVVHIARVNKDPKHYRYWYYLRKYFVSDKGRKFYKTLTVTGGPMRDLYTGNRTISDVISGKVTAGMKYKNHVFQNTIMAKFVED